MLIADLATLHTDVRLFFSFVLCVPPLDVVKYYQTARIICTTAFFSFL